MTTIDTFELHRANTRFAQLIAHLQGGVLVEDETRHIVLMNQAFCDLFNISLAAEALIGTDYADNAETIKTLFVDPEGFVNRTNHILQERQPVARETLHLRDGRMFSRDYVPVYQDDTFIGHLWHYHDVTETFQTQRRWERLLHIEEVNREIIRLFLQLENSDEAVNQALAMTGHLLDVSRVYVFRFRENERITDNTHEWCAPGIKPEIENLQGLPFDDLIPSIFPMMAEHDLIAPAHISELPDDLRGILEPQDIQTVLWVPFYLNERLEGFVGYDETRHAREWLPEEITMVRIITESYARALEREQARRMLIKARDEAVRTAQLRAQFVANMSHEIRTPMTGTMGMLELLLETELDELQHEFATEALKSSLHLLNLINDILDFSKLEAGQVVLQADQIDLKAILTEVKMTLDPQIKDKALQIEVAIASDTPHRVYGDATRIRQVLMNLAGNAIKFTPAGRVLLSISGVRNHNNVAGIRFTVQDTGIGIAAEHLERIFESFVQADGSMTRKFGGSGLGLSISKQLVELMGGTISVESIPGEGSTFSFVLHLPVAQATGIDKIASTGFSDLNVLIIDNNRTARYVLAQQLENWGCMVCQIPTLDELETTAASLAQPFDIIFYRYVDSSSVEHIQKRLLRFTQQSVYVTDSTSTTHPDGEMYLHWPIDQSSLYNLLLQTTHIDTLDKPVVPASNPAVNQGRILLVDDHPMNVALVRYALADMQMQVDFVTNGQEALDQFATTSYDLVLMDMQMPVMDGLEATRRIRQSSTTVPILALTASVMREQKSTYLAAGIDEIISKPFSVKHLREVVQRWLEKLDPITSE